MVINRKVLPWLIAGVALAAILLIVLVMVTQAAPNSAPHRQGASISPSVVSYQGQVNIGGVPFSGTGYFRFAIVDSGGTFYWSNDSNTVTPTEAVTLTVVNGLFNALLGETNPITYGMFSNSDRWLRIWFDDGIHGVQLLEPDAPFTTAPFTFQADNAMTAMTATIAMNALTFNTLQPSIIGDPYNGDPRGLCAVDLQLARANPNQTACGPYSTISGGRSNVAGGSYSVVGGGWENYVSGYIATVIGGRLNSARGNYSVASGFRADTGIGRNGVFIFGDSSDEDFTGIINDEFAIRARGGFRHAYDNSNWWTAKVTSGGAVTFDSVGTAPGFTISDSLTVNGIFSATVLTATYATTALTATNATTATYATTAGSATTALTATNATTATYATTALTATNLTQSPYARIYNDANISIPAYTWITITFNSELWDTNNFHSTESNTSRMIAPVTGTYLITFNGRFASSSSGERFVYLRMNANGAIAGGTGIAYTSTATRVGGYQTGVSATALYFLTAEDYVEAFVMQSSDVTLACTYSANDSPQLTMVLLP